MRRGTVFAKPQQTPTHGPEAWLEKSLYRPHQSAGGWILAAPFVVHNRQWHLRGELVAGQCHKHHRGNDPADEDTRNSRLEVHSLCSFLRRLFILAAVCGPNVAHWK